MFDLSLLIFLNTIFIAAVGFIAGQGGASERRRRVCGYLGIFLVGINILLGLEVKGRESVQQEEQKQQDFDRYRAQLRQTLDRLRYEKELRAKADEITMLNREIVAGITGGDSFVYASFMTEGNRAWLSLDHRGKYPVFDVSIEITDMDEFYDRLGKLGFIDHEGVVTYDQVQEVMKGRSTFSYATVRPNLVLKMSDSWQLPATKDTANYSLAIYSRNGNFSEDLRLRRVNGVWTQALQVFRNDPRNKKPRILLFEFADREFPRDKTGKVNWKELELKSLPAPLAAKVRKRSLSGRQPTERDITK